MNFLNAVTTTATYHSTEMGERWTLSSLGTLLLSFSIILILSVMALSVMLLFTEKMPTSLMKAFRIEKLKKKIRFDEQVTISMTGMDITMSIMIILILVATIISQFSLITRTDHLVHNIQQKYAIEDIKWSESNSLYSPEEKLEATVTKGEKTYEVTVTQNSNTYEPTLLLTPEANVETTELLK